MAEKIKIAVNWAGSCGGCDVSLLDIQMKFLELVELADIVYWPVAMDFKLPDLLALPDGSVDFGLYNGGIRTSEHREAAHIFRRKCKLLVAYGSCACFGGIPGLANLSGRDDVFRVAYQETPSTDNPEGIRPQTRWSRNGHDLTLPEFLDCVGSLPQAVPVDVLVPGCPPPNERVNDLVSLLGEYARSGKTPATGTVLAEDKALCDSCPRVAARQGGRLAAIVRPHEVIADPARCFLDQGIICLGLATRGGCGATCIAANMPCRGCFGPTAEMLDPAAEAISAIGSIAGEAEENWVEAHKMKKAVRSICDPAGTFYRFTLPSAFVSHAVADKPKE